MCHSNNSSSSSNNNNDKKKKKKKNKKKNKKNTFRALSCAADKKDRSFSNTFQGPRLEQRRQLGVPLQQQQELLWEAEARHHGGICRAGNPAQ